MYRTSKHIKTLLLSFALSAVGGSFAADKVVPIGVAEFPPFKYAAPDGKVIGSDTEIVEQVFKRMGYTPKIEMQPWKRVQEEAQKGNFAAIYTFTKNPDREKIYHFSDPISTVRDVFYKKKSKKIAWSGLDDLKTMRVGASAGYSYHAVFKYAAEAKKFAAFEEVFQSPPELANLKKLMADRIDLFICEVSVCQYFVKNNAADLNDVDFIDKTIGDVRTFHVGFPKVYPGSEQLAKDFNTELAKFVKEGKRKPIFKKYSIVTDLK
jgi:polar amino acid transport system substrate-binding protein